jgi:ppGpp synthetase/RelA/SpoT-type nucleotidyltranferase
VLLPASREQINKLGKRLASDVPVSDEDLHALEELTACHMTALELARPRVNDLATDLGITPLHITHRPKTTQTIIEKLRREQGMALARVQDLAGIRIVGAIKFEEQDRLAMEIVRRFPADPREPRIVDRRANPSHGYRAIHVIVSLNGVTIEVQVRTLMQHMWADLMERLADRLGRQIRYGEPPVPPPGMNIEQARGILRAMMSTSDKWAIKDVSDSMAGVEAGPLQVERLTDAIWGALAAAVREVGIDL